MHDPTFRERPAMRHQFLALFGVLLGMLLSADPGLGEDLKALRMIVVPDQKTATAIRRQLRQGASFSALAGTHSIGPERRQWGYSGVVKLDDVQPELRAVLRRLKPGQISDVQQLGNVYVLVKVISPDIERHYATAEQAMRDQRFDDAIRALGTALRLEKDSVQTYLKLGAAYDAARRYEEAIKYLDKAQHYAPEATQIAILRGAVYTRAAINYKNPTYAQRALEAYQQALRLDGRLAPAVHFGMGKVYLLALQQPERAIDHLEQAVQLTPSVPEVYGLIIQAYYDTKRYPQAWKYLRLAQSLGIEFPKLREALFKADPQRQR